MAFYASILIKSKSLHNFHKKFRDVVIVKIMLYFYAIYFLVLVWTHTLLLVQIVKDPMLGS